MIAVKRGFILPAFCVYSVFILRLTFSRDARLFTFQKLFCCPHQDGFDTLFRQKWNCFCVLHMSGMPYWLSTINSLFVSAVFQKTYVTQKPRSTPPLDLTVSGQNEKH